MVVENLTDGEVDALFHALADSTRRDIVGRVLRREQSVSGLAAGYSMSFAAIQKHVAVLERAHLVRKERRGRQQMVFPAPDVFRRAAQLLDEYDQLWRDRVGRIDHILASD